MIHELVFLPECLMLLLGKDLLMKLETPRGAKSLTFGNKEYFDNDSDGRCLEKRNVFSR